MEIPGQSLSSDGDSEFLFSLPVPPEPLRRHLPLPVETMVKQMEALLAATDQGPEFEAMRLKSKNPKRFRM